MAEVSVEGVEEVVAALRDEDPRLQLTFGSPTGGTPFWRVVDENDADIYVFRTVDGEPTELEVEPMLANLRAQYRAELPSEAEQAERREAMRQERLRVRREATAKAQALRTWGRSVSDAEWRRRHLRQPLSAALLERVQSTVQRGTSRERRNTRAASARGTVRAGPADSSDGEPPPPPLGGPERTRQGRA